jgi:TolB-like protein
MKKLSMLIFIIMMGHMPAFSADKIVLAIFDLEARDVSAQEASKVSLLMRNEMQNSARMAVVEPGLVVNAMKGQGGAACVEKECAVRVGKALGVNKVLIGTVMRIGGHLAVTARIIDVETGTVDFAEKERALSEADEVYMVERFCDKVAARITGKQYGAETAADIKPKMPYGTEYYSKYRAVKDPLAWISLGLGISSGFGFLAAQGTYESYNKFGSILDYASLVFLSPMTASNTNVQLLFLMLYNESRKSKSHAREQRNTRFYASTGIGGAAVVLLATFVGRAINASIQEGKTVKSGDVSLALSENFYNSSPWRNRDPFNYSLGLTVWF